MASISGRSINNDEIEMEDHKTSAAKSHEDDDSEEDSDGVQFISIKVTNPDGAVRDEKDMEAEPVRPRKTVTMLEPQRSPDDHSEISSYHNFNIHPAKHPDSPYNEFGKTFFLVCIWFLMIVFLTSTPEKKIEKRQLVLPKDEPKFYNFPSQPTSTLVHVTIKAPFLSDPREYTRRKVNNQTIDTRNKDNTLVIYLRTNTERLLTPNKTFYIYKPEEIDFVNASNLEFMFDIGEDNFFDLEEHEVVQAVILSNFSKTPQVEKQEMAIIFSVDFTPINKPIGVLFAAFTLILLYALIVWEVTCDTLFACLLTKV